MQEKMYHLWKEYKDSIDGLSTRYYAAMSSLKDIPEKIPGDQIKEQAPHISAQLEHKMAELGEGLAARGLSCLLTKIMYPSWERTNRNIM